MPHHVLDPLVLPVLGIPVRFHADDPRLRAVVERAFGRWRTLDDALVAPPSTGAGPVVHLSTGAAVGGGHATTIRTPGPQTLVLTAPGVEARADAVRFEGVVEVAEAARDDEDAVRHALDTVVLFLLTRLDRQPVHGAAVARDGAGVVLTGPSGVGKSTLAYAAWQGGFEVLSDDAVYVQLDPVRRVWGMGRPGHLRADTAAWFPETAGIPLRERPSGGRKRAVAFHGDLGGGGLRPAPVVGRTSLCLVERRAGPTRVEAVDPHGLVAHLASTLDPGFDVWRDTIPQRLSALAGGGAWRLMLGGPPAEAVPFLREMLPDHAGSG